MLCYPCATNGVKRQAVALCTSCSAGLCQEHVRETATQLASGNPFAGCRHDTWAVVPGRPERREQTSRPVRPRRTTVDRLRNELARETGSRGPRMRGE